MNVMGYARRRWQSSFLSIVQFLFAAAPKFAVERQVNHSERIERSQQHPN